MFLFFDFFVFYLPCCWADRLVSNCIYDKENFPFESRSKTLLQHFWRKKLYSAIEQIISIFGCPTLDHSLVICSIFKCCQTLSLFPFIIQIWIYLWLGPLQTEPSIPVWMKRSFTVMCNIPKTDDIDLCSALYLHVVAWNISPLFSVKSSA